MPTLAELFAELQKMPFPEFPEDDDFADWLAEVAEMDAHVAGLAQSALSGARVNRGDVPMQVDSLARKLALVAPSSGSDLLLVDQCKQYLHLVRQVAEHLPNG